MRLDYESKRRKENKEKREIFMIMKNYCHSALDDCARCCMEREENTFDKSEKLSLHRAFLLHKKSLFHALYARKLFPFISFYSFCLWEGISSIEWTFNLNV